MDINFEAPLQPISMEEDMEFIERDDGDQSHKDPRTIALRRLGRIHNVQMHYDFKNMVAFAFVT